MQLFPFDQPGRFYRGNLHCHSNLSDGELSPQAVCEAYARNGYDFISLTDHFHPAFEYPIADTRPYRTNSFTTIIGTELHHGFTQNGIMWHIVANGLPFDFAPPEPSESAADLVARAAAAGAFIEIPHPQWSNLTLQDALDLGEHVHAVELFNATCLENDTAYSDYYLDGLLSLGKRYGAVAVDDAHFSGGGKDAFQGWVMVKATANEPDLLLAALKAGAYYASQGPLIHNIEIDDGRLKIECSPVAQVILKSTAPASFVGAEAIGPAYKAKQGNGMRETSFRIDNYTADWGRLVLIDRHGRRAWSNVIEFEG